MHVQPPEQAPLFGSSLPPPASRAVLLLRVAAVVQGLGAFSHLWIALAIPGAAGRITVLLASAAPLSLVLAPFLGARARWAWWGSVAVAGWGVVCPVGLILLAPPLELPHAMAGVLPGMVILGVAWAVVGGGLLMLGREALSAARARD